MKTILMMLCTLPLFGVLPEMNSKGPVQQPVQQQALSAPMVQCFKGAFKIARSQHPMKASRNQAYFKRDIKGKKYVQTWIADLSNTHFKAIKRDVPVEVCGHTETIDFGGKPGTRGSYKNTMLVVSSVKYLKKSEPKSESKCFTGRFAPGMMQHPMVAPRNQGYFVPGKGRKMGPEWLLDLSKEQLKIAKSGTLAKICGTQKAISLGGKPGTKRSYGNTMIVVETITLLEKVKKSPKIITE